MSHIRPPFPPVPAYRTVPEQVEPVHLSVEASYGPPSMMEKLTVRAREAGGATVREVSYPVDQFDQRERDALVRLLAGFVAEARGAKLAVP